MDNKNKRTYSIDIDKVVQILNIFSKGKYIKLSDGHRISTKDEIKYKKYYKYHNIFRHITNNFVFLRIWLRKQLSKDILGSQI